jgi:hypothetical protein
MAIARTPSVFLQLCTGRPAIGVAGVVLFSLLCSNNAGAAVYQCKGNGGVTVLTDRPAGLRDCVQIQTIAPSPSHSTSPTPEIRTPSDPDQRPPVILPDPTAPPVPPRETFREPVPPQADMEKPPVPTAADTQHCSQTINPLNPLAGGNCPPAAAEPPVDPKTPNPPDQTSP